MLGLANWRSVIPWIGAVWADILDEPFLVFLIVIFVAIGFQLLRTRGQRPTAITTTTWDAFQQGLAGELARLDVYASVIISATAERRCYAQFAARSATLHAEVVSNRFLRGALRQSAEQAQRLAGAGWQPPDERHPNWWVERPWPLPVAGAQQLATLCVLALHDVLGIAQPQALEYRAWNEGTQTRVDLPALHPAGQ